MDYRPQSSDGLDSQRRVRRDMPNILKGTLLTVVAGIAWGLSGTSGQYLMAHGISALVLTNLRLLIAGGILMVLAYATAKDKMLAFLKDRKSLLSLLIFALIGLFLNQFAYTAFLKGTSLIGPVKSSLLASIEPISAVFFAFLIMNEQFYPIDFLGMAMILIAVTLISLKDLLLEK